MTNIPKNTICIWYDREVEEPRHICAMSALARPVLPTVLRLRPARADEAEGLTAIARAAKAHWGYDETLMTAWQADLVVSPAAIARGLVCVAEAEGLAIGLAELVLTPHEARLGGLWVHPRAMRRGAGRALLDWACAEARRAGHATLAIDSDPNAEAFYLSRGAERLGSVPAPLPGQPDRVRPQLQLATTPRDPASA
jgi:GNAT superfamily N-acetyltransferase